ncbi:hypothetical protein COF61_23305 [Bacillus toyonensis]|uniref:hypothetical protein n=1 Tax=Bacillus toyonensis TaxID=155322 RepID=UPI0009023834|nr:hypothetical protein [Bacillus toyonensis]PHD58330.1 hypothetical protein COF61_23305 [Bacillus toyonensis]
MNSEQRKHGQNNEYKHQNHGVSCNCGCQQGKYEYEQKQDREEYNNSYMSNEQTQNHEGMGYLVAKEGTRNDMYNSVKREFREHDMYHENKNYYSCSPRQFNTLNLPDESKRFQTITHVQNTNSNPSLNATSTTRGQNIDGSNNFCRSISLDFQLINQDLNTTQDTFYYLFYLLDSGDFIIANYGTGRVLENRTVEPDERAIISSLYTGSVSQFFRKRSSVNNQFILSPQQELNRAVNVCNNTINLATKITSGFNIPDNTSNVFRHIVASNRPITIPSFSNESTLGPAPVLTSLSDYGPSPAQAERAVIGSALIPCIFVNDVLPLERRIKESPYYVLEYRQYWHRLWTDEIPSGDRRSFGEITGILPNAQASMRDMIDMSIGADWGLRFGDSSTPFKRGILNSLNTQGSYADVDLGTQTGSNQLTNFNSFSVRYARFVKAHEYRLTRSNGTVVTTPWVALDYRVPQTARFPLNAQLSQNYKIISSYNSYDLPVLEHTDNKKKW